MHAWHASIYVHQQARKQALMHTRMQLWCGCGVDLVLLAAARCEQLAACLLPLAAEQADPHRVRVYLPDFFRGGVCL